MMGRRLVLLGAVLLSGVSVAWGQDTPRLVEREVASLGPVPKGARHIAVSPDGRRIAFVVRKDGKAHVVCDGKTGPGYDRIIANTMPRLRFSPDGKRLLYPAQDKDPSRLFIFGEEDRPIHGYRGRFTPKGNALIYVARREGGFAVVHDGRAGPVVPSVLYGSPLFTPDGGRIAYRYRDENGRVVLNLDGKPVPGPTVLSDPVFSADGRHIVYAVRCRVAGSRPGSKRKGQRVIFDGKEGPPYLSVNSLAISPDGKRVAYSARHGRGNVDVLVCDGKEVARVIDGARQITFSPDGRRLVYEMAGNHGDTDVVCDGKLLGRRYRTVGHFVFSPDSRHVAFFAELRSRKNVVVVDGSQGGPGPAVWMTGITSARVYPIYHRSQPVFSADSRHLFYVGWNWQLVCDGLEGPRHDRMWIPRISREGHEKMRVVVLDKGEASLVEVDWPADRTWQDAFKTAKP